MTVDRAHPGRSVRTAVVWGVLSQAVDEYRRAAGLAPDAGLDLVDLGGGTGGFAVARSVWPPGGHLEWEAFPFEPTWEPKRSGGPCECDTVEKEC